MFIAFTRIFVGLHTAEQILTGLGSGLIVHILMGHIYFDTLEKLFIGIETGKTQFFNYLSTLYLGVNLMAVLFYFMIDFYYPSPQAWLEMIQKS